MVQVGVAALERWLHPTEAEAKHAAHLHPPLKPSALRALEAEGTLAKARGHGPASPRRSESPVLERILERGTRAESQNAPTPPRGASVLRVAPLTASLRVRQARGRCS